MSFALTREHFEEIVWQVIANLPEAIKSRLENVLVVIEDFPNDETQAEFEEEVLLGLYQGVPLTERSVLSIETGPDVIYIFQKNVESVCETEEEIRDEIRTTVIHEIGHYFGLDEAQLEVLEKDFRA